MKNQVSRQTRLDAADDIILNVDNLDSLSRDIQSLHAQYIALSK